MSNISNDSGVKDSATYSEPAVIAEPPRSPSPPRPPTSPPPPAESNHTSSQTPQSPQSPQSPQKSQSPQSPQSSRSLLRRPPSSPSYPPTTRLSWFLAEVDEGSMKGDRPNGLKQFCVLHSMEIIEADVSDKYMTRIVEFKLNGRPLEAKLILAADDRSLVEAAKSAMTREHRDPEEDAQQLLVQYEEEDDVTGNRLVQQVISQVGIQWMSARPELGGTPLIQTAGGCIAHVLHYYEHRDYMEKVLMYLKARCFNKIFNDTFETAMDPMDNNTWMLVQYSPEPETVVYQVVSYSHTVWRQGNHYKDVVAYIQLPGTETILQTIVIAFSKKKADMEAKYEQIRSFALEMDIPKIDELDHEEPQGTTAVFTRTRTTIFDRNERRDVTGEHRALRRQLEDMNETADAEAQMLMDAFGMVDNIQRNVDSVHHEADLLMVAGVEL